MPLPADSLVPSLRDRRSSPTEERASQRLQCSRTVFRILLAFRANKKYRARSTLPNTTTQPPAGRIFLHSVAPTDRQVLPTCGNHEGGKTNRWHSPYSPRPESKLGDRAPALMTALVA